MEIRRIVRVVAIAAAISTGVAPLATAQLPEEAIPCIPAGATDIQLRASAERDELTYYYLIGIDPEQNAPFVSVSQVDHSGQCEVLLDGSDITQSLDDVKPYEVAFELYRQNYELAIELAGGKQELEGIFQQEVDSDIDTYRSEAEVAALQDLGVEFPDLYTLSSANPDIDSLVEAFLHFNEPPGPKSINRVEIVGDYAIASWFQRGDASGHYVGQRVDGEWRALGSTDSAEGALMAEKLRDRFGVPLDIASELVRASQSN
ncbi:MAG: hypothetical protein AB4040_01305 [Synechococcus sp.]